MQIREDDLTGPEIHALLREHLSDMNRHSPPDSIHALDLTGLTKPDITFWTAWHNNHLMGCGAIKELDRTHGEIKSMRTASTQRRKGVAAAMLKHILAESRQRTYQRVSLETGSMDAFKPARQLYSRFGFVECPPFSDYQPDPNSVFMTLNL